MDETSLIAALNDAGYSNVEEVARTETSTLYRATATSTGAVVEVEEFNISLVDATVAAINRDAPTLATVNQAGTFNPLTCGIIDGEKLYVVREAPEGTPLRELARQRFASEGRFSAAEAHNLLSGVAAAIDAYGEAGRAGFVSRSIDQDRLLAQPGWASAPVKMTLVGPTPNSEMVTPANNRVAFIELVAELTGMPINAEMVERTGNCSNYLRELAGLPPVVPAASRFVQRLPKRTNAWPWVALAAALVLLVAAGIWWWTERGSAWDGDEAALYETYPELISKREGQTGWNDLTCLSATPEPGQTAKIRCADENLGVSVALYEKASERNEGLPGSDKAVRLGSGSCMINSFEVPDATPPAFVMAPLDHKDIRLVINGADAEAKRLDLPLCAAAE